ncbi:MAG: FecR domain-containing protein [Rhodoferax sp.]|nr:FecR domain-containing protein [Rhodoferax sp.]
MRNLKWIGSVLSLVLFSHTAMAADEAGMVKVSKGSVGLERGGQRLAAPVGTRIFASDRIVTGADGSVGITLRDNTLLSAGPNSTVDLIKFAFNSTTHSGAIDASVKRGTLSVISGKIAKATPEAVSFSAPGMTLGVRGTSFLIDAGQ